MPQIQLSPDARMFYRDNDFTDPWLSPDAMLLLHGNHESGAAWNGWVPLVARRFRTIRPDMRGFGQSTAMPEDYPWTLDGIIGDYMQLMDELGIERFHLVAAKFAGPLAVRLAARNPKRVRTLAVLGAPASGEAREKHVSGVRGFIERDGYETWARETMPARLGTNCPPEMLHGWYEVMRGTPMSTVIGFRRVVQGLDVGADLPHVVAPTLVITTEGSGSDFSVALTRPWQERIHGSELLILPGDSYHVAATHPEVCARAVLDFIDRHPAA